MSAAATFYSQFASTPTPAQVSAFARRLARTLGAIGLTLVGAYPEPKARRVIGVRRRSVPGFGGAVMNANEQSEARTEREWRQWFVALAFGVDAPEAVPPVPPPAEPVRGDVLP